MMTTTLHDLPNAAADYIATHGWTQDTLRDESGSVCLTGALRACSPRTGDWLIAREVFRNQDHAEDWNDEADRIASEVMGYLRSHPITDADLATTFGPQWQQIVALIRRAAILTSEEQQGLVAAVPAWRDAQLAVLLAAEDSDRDAAWGAAGEAAQDAAQDSAEHGTWNAAWSPPKLAAGYVAQSAARALVVADLVGQYDLEQHHIEALLFPWQTVIADSASHEVSTIATGTPAEAYGVPHEVVMRWANQPHAHPTTP